MVIDLLEDQCRWPPHYAGKSLKKVEIIDSPPGTVGASVPPHSASAIVYRFGKLADN
jgi:hypothetical protein